LTTFDLRKLKLRPGEEHRETIELELPPFEFGGQPYLAVPGVVAARLAVNRVNSGTAFWLAFDTRLHGPCYRCLEDAVLDVSVEAREYQAEAPEGDDETSPYFVDNVLQLSDWARDAVALAVPDKILCRPDCAGLCPVCGKNLNDEPHTHEEETVDPRWAALEELRDEL
jgi:uncharacterized protein